MTNIEKLYELAKIDKKLDCQRCGAKELKAGKCFDVDCESTYPPFTFNKAVGLNNWLLNNKHNKYIQLVDKKTSYYGLLKFDNEEEEKKFIKNDVYQALAGLVCELWEDLTPKQREEIKRILE